MKLPDTDGLAPSPLKGREQAKCTAQRSFLHLVLGMIKGFQSPAVFRQTVRAQCFEWGFNVNETPQSLVGIVDFIGERLKLVEFHPPHSYEIKVIS